MKRNPLFAAHVIVGPFSIEPQEFWTECECPECLCKHLPDRMRPYYGWIVWDSGARAERSGVMAVDGSSATVGRSQ